MRYILILLIAMLPAFAIAGEKSTADQCKCSDPESGECKYEVWACLWGDKLNELEDKAMNLGELFRAAIVDNEYAPLEKHLEYPIEIHVIDFQNANSSYLSDTEQYDFIINDMEDFNTKFASIMLMDNDKELKEFFTARGFHYTFFDSNLALGNGAFRIQAKIRCADFKPTINHPELLLPRDRKFCKKSSIAVKSIEITLNSN